MGRFGFLGHRGLGLGSGFWNLKFYKYAILRKALRSLKLAWRPKNREQRGCDFRYLIIFIWLFFLNSIQRKRKKNSTILEHTTQKWKEVEYCTVKIKIQVFFCAENYRSRFFCSPQEVEFAVLNFATTFGGPKKPLNISGRKEVKFKFSNIENHHHRSLHVACFILNTVHSPEQLSLELS